MRLKTYSTVGVALYILLSVTDLFLTFTLLRLNGEAYESNPAAAACLEQHGWSGLALYKAGGVAVFVAAVVLIARRRPGVGAAVVTFGCTVMLAVTVYSHGLIRESERELADLDAGWGHKPTARADRTVPERYLLSAR